MSRMSPYTVLALALLSSIEPSLGLRIPFTKRDTTTLPALATLNMPLQFGADGGYRLGVVMSTNAQQKFDFGLTTGTGLTMVAGNSCGDCTNTSLYNQGSSTSAASLSKTDNTTFFSGSASGSMIKENCGAKLSNGSYWNYTNQTVLVVEKQSNAILANGASGLFGLGTNLQSSLQNATSGIGFQDSVYGQYYNRNPDRTNFTFGMMLLPTTPKTESGASAGAIHWLQPDQQYYDTGSVSWKNVDTAAAGSGNSSLDTSQDWTVGLDGWTASAGNTHLSNSASVVAIVDPMYPNIYLPSTQAKLIHDAIGGTAASSSLSTLGGLSQAYTVPCNVQFSFSLMVGVQNFVLNTDQLVNKQSDGTCVSGIEGFVDASETRYLVGSRFISTIYLIFNIPRDGNPALGFSPRTQPKSKSNVGPIVGGTIGGVGGVIILGLVAFYFLRRRADRKRGPYEIDADDKAPHNVHVEPYTVGNPTPAQLSVVQESPRADHPLLDGGAAPPSYEEASSSGSPATSSFPRDAKGRPRVLSGITENTSSSGY